MSYEKNWKNGVSVPLNIQKSGASMDRASEDSDVIYYSEDSLSDAESILQKKVCLPQLVTVVGVMKMT